MQPASVKEPQDTLLFDQMEIKLSRLAAQWRGAGRQGDQSRQATIADLYQRLLICMIQMGWQDWLDVDSELPDEWMPVEYLAYARQK